MFTELARAFSVAIGPYGAACEFLIVVVPGISIVPMPSM